MTDAPSGSRRRGTLTLAVAADSSVCHVLSSAAGPVESAEPLCGQRPATEWARVWQFHPEGSERPIPVCGTCWARFLGTYG